MRNTIALRRPNRGAASVEWLLAAPVVLILGLSVLQWGLVFFGRNAIEFALQQAVREGSHGHALAGPIDTGLARGLIPFWGLASPGQPLDTAVPRALARLAVEKVNGVLVWRQISPTVESFNDWAVPARDAMGDVVAGVVEIPNDSLQFQSASVGSASGQTLKDANLLKLEMYYGVPLKVPLVAPIAVMVMETLNGCGGSGSPSAATSGAWACRFYRAPDESGQAQLRWPVQMVATIRMQTAARKSGITPARQASPIASAAGSGGTGTPNAPGSPGDTSAGTASGGASQSGASTGTSGASAGGAGSGTGTSTEPGSVATSGTATGNNSGTTGGPGQISSGTSSSAGQGLASEILSRIGANSSPGLSCPAS